MAGGMLKKMFGGGASTSGGATKANAEKKSESALQTLHATSQDTEAKLVDLHRRMGEIDKEVKGFLQKGQRERAKGALRRKKVLEKQATSVQNNADRLQEQILMTESAQNNIETVMALKQAAAAGKANLKAHNIDDVDAVLDEIAEQNDQMSQIQDALAQSALGGIDEDDLQAELDELAEEQIDVAFSAVPAPTQQVPADKLPTAPTTAATTSGKTAEDLELEKLMEETGMMPA